jgi:hypothetical protein
MIGARCFHGLLVDRPQLPCLVEQPILFASVSDARLFEDVQPVFYFVRLLEHDAEARDELFARASSAGCVVIR